MSKISGAGEGSGTQLCYHNLESGSAGLYRPQTLPNQGENKEVEKNRMGDSAVMSQTKDWRRRSRDENHRKYVIKSLTDNSTHGSVTPIEISPTTRTSSWVRPLCMPSVSEIFYAPVITVEAQKYHTSSCTHRNIHTYNHTYACMSASVR